MAISPGTRFGPYEITSALGAGGMGEVYRATDTRLGRTVAIKVLPSHLSADPQLRQRFEREARAVSSLSHPHICALHDIGNQDGTDFLVMEYLEGETLADRLTKGPLPLDQVLRYAIEIADGLDKAHKAGIVHRDLKPGNVMITKTGAKLLDFGLARVVLDKNDVEVGGSALATKEAQNLTAEGTILGTVQYMSPEQLEGQEVDFRTDIFAFGVTLYEMVTAQKAFSGKSRASLIASILQTDPPPVSSLQPLTPPALDRLVQTCIAKDPDERWQSAHDLMSQLKWIQEGRSEAGIAAPVVARRKTRDRLLGAVIGAALVVLIMAAAARMQAPASDPHTGTHLVLNLPPGDVFAYSPNRPFFAFSPDGKSIVYAARRNNTTQLYLRVLDQPEPTPIPGTENGQAPFFSPDGRWLGFSNGQEVKRVPLSGGAAISICESGDMTGASWSEDKKIFVIPTWRSSLLSFPETGGNSWEVAKLDVAKKEYVFLWPEALPGGNAILLTVGPIGQYMANPAIVAQPLPSGQRETLIEKGSFPKYLPTGHIVYVQGGSLYAVSFDAEKLEVTGSAIPILDRVVTSASYNYAAYSLSKEGTLAYVPGSVRSAERTLVWLDRKGRETSASDLKRAYATPRVSPDGKRLALLLEGATYDVYVQDLARETLTRLSFYGDEWKPIWTPDGKRVVYRSPAGGGRPNIYSKAYDGSSPEQRLTTIDSTQYPNSVSPDGKFLAFHQDVTESNSDLWMLRLHGGQKAEPFLSTQFDEEYAEFSPDGRWIAYVSNESGRYEVYVVTFPGPGGKTQISTEGGSEPRWSRDGRELFYRNDRKWMAVQIQTGSDFTASRPVVLFEGDYRAEYDVAPDGRFLVVKERQDQTPMEMHVIIGWLDQVKEKLHR